MWIFSRYGMFSVVCGKSQTETKGKGKGKAKDFTGSLDKNTFMVRGRDRNHLERLIARFPVLEPFPINESTSNDYRFRIIVPKSIWVDVMMMLGEDIDYGNFKSEAGRCHGHQSPYLDVCHKVWGAGYGHQSKKYGQGIYGGGRRNLSVFDWDDDVSSSAAGVRNQYQCRECRTRWHRDAATEREDRCPKCDTTNPPRSSEALHEPEPEGDEYLHEMERRRESRNKDLHNDDWLADALDPIATDLMDFPDPGDDALVWVVKSGQKNVGAIVSSGGVSDGFPEMGVLQDAVNEGAFEPFDNHDIVMMKFSEVKAQDIPMFGVEPTDLHNKEADMSGDKPQKGMLVEDTTVTGGKDKNTGADVIKPKTAEGKADESVKPTDPREASKAKH